LREAIEAIKQRIIEMIKALVNALKSEGETVSVWFKEECNSIRDSLTDIRNDIVEAKQIRLEAVQQDIVRVIDNGDLVTFNQYISSGERFERDDDFPKLFAAALGRNDKIGYFMAEELIHAAGDTEVDKYSEEDRLNPDFVEVVRLKGFSRINPTLVLKEAMISRDYHTVHWLRQREELPLVLNDREMGGLLYTAVHDKYPKTAQYFITTWSPNYSPQDVLQGALREALDNHDYKTAKALISHGADVPSFAKDIANEDLTQQILDKDGRKFMNDLLKHWNDLEPEQSEHEEEHEDFER
jgi:hypothetical protein